jgi:selenocysteine lyase/cysteine desulfurase
MLKRDFLRTLGATAAGAALAPAELLARAAHLAPEATADDDAFWTALRGGYRLTPDRINLEHGYYSMQSEGMLEAWLGHVRRVNHEASWYLRTAQAEGARAAREALARVAGCAPTELVVTRNTTESLDTVISGYDWRAGDEAVMARQDYGAMLDHFRLMARRHGIVNRVIDLPHDPPDDDAIVRRYAEAITPRTRLLMVCHLVNITGQVLPVRRIADMAHARGVDVLVDGAHAFAHLDFRIPDTGADYYGASLHKWLGVPLGAGLLWVRPAKVATLWPLYGESPSVRDDDVLKLNHRGTHPVHTDLAIVDAVAQHEAIGAARKQARLRHVQRWWTDRVRDVPGIEVQTPRDPARSGAIATVGVRGLAPRELHRRLLAEHRVWTVAIDGAGVHGVRVTPHLFTTTAELDTLVRALVGYARG